MAFTVNIYYTGTCGNARKFAEEMKSSGLMDKIRAEKGNLRYEYFLPMDDDETVLLIDAWENDEALAFHHKSPMMKEIAALREKYNLKMRVQKFNEINLQFFTAVIRGVLQNSEKCKALRTKSKKFLRKATPLR